MTIRNANTPLYSFLPGVAWSWIAPDATLTTTEPQLLSCGSEGVRTCSLDARQGSANAYSLVDPVRRAEVRVVGDEERDRRDPGEGVGREGERAEDGRHEGVHVRVGEERKDDDVERGGPGDCERRRGVRRRRRIGKGTERTHQSACGCRTGQRRCRGRA